MVKSESLGVDCSFLFTLSNDQSWGKMKKGDFVYFVYLHCPWAGHFCFCLIRFLEHRTAG